MTTIHTHRGRARARTGLFHSYRARCYRVACAGFVLENNRAATVASPLVTMSFNTKCMFALLILLCPPQQSPRLRNNLRVGWHRAHHSPYILSFCFPFFKGKIARLCPTPVGWWGRRWRSVSDAVPSAIRLATWDTSLKVMPSATS
jgi:hypothetical protein